MRQRDRALLPRVPGGALRPGPRRRARRHGGGDLAVPALLRGGAPRRGADCHSHVVAPDFRSHGGVQIATDAIPACLVRPATAWMCCAHVMSIKQQTQYTGRKTGTSMPTCTGVDLQLQHLHDAARAHADGHRHLQGAGQRCLTSLASLICSHQGRPAWQRPRWRQLRRTLHNFVSTMLQLIGPAPVDTQLPLRLIAPAQA